MEPKQKILIVDDSEINRAMLKEILGEGYEYLEAENGLRAIEILRRRTDIALVLLDLIMPEMDGFDVLRVMQCYAWQEEIPVIQVVVQTGGCFQKQRSRHAVQVQRGAQGVGKQTFDRTNGALRVVQVQRRRIVCRDDGFAHNKNPSSVGFWP